MVIERFLRSLYLITRSATAVRIFVSQIRIITFVGSIFIAICYAMAVFCTVIECNISRIIISWCNGLFGNYYYWDYYYRKAFSLGFGLTCLQEPLILSKQLQDRNTTLNQGQKHIKRTI